MTAPRSRAVLAFAVGATAIVALTGCAGSAQLKSASAQTPNATATATAAPSATPTPTPTPTQTVAAAPATAPAPAPAAAVGPANANCAANAAGVKRIYVSIAQQHMWACLGTSLAFDSAVTTGASALTNVHDATPTGTFRIDGKARNVHLVGHDANGSWNDFVAYWIPYIGSVYGFHDASWQTFPFGSPLYTTQGSHGCVHLPLATIAEVYNWAPIGTQVTIS